MVGLNQIVVQGSTPALTLNYVNGGMSNVISPMLINSYSSLKIPAYWRAVNFLATNLASFPRSVHKDGAKRGSDEQPHQLDTLLKSRPNQMQNAFVFWRTLFFHAAHMNNGYVEISRSRQLALFNRLPEDVCPFRYDRGDGSGLQQYYFYYPEKRVINGADMIHLQSLGYDGLAGMDDKCLHAETFQRANMIDRYTTRFLQKGTCVRGSIEIPAGVGDKQVEQIRDVISRFFTGSDAERDLLILSDGATLKNGTLSPHDSQLMQQGAYSTKQIAQITGVPPQFLYEFGESKYNNSVELMGQEVVRFTFRPWIEQTEAELTLKLLSTADQLAGYQVKLNPDALLRGDTKATADTVLATTNGGLRTRNEGRAMLDLPPDADPESDKLRVLGSQTSPPPPTSTPPPDPAQQHSKARAAAVFTAMAPVIAAACSRVDSKTDKAFASNAKKTGHTFTEWANIFADQQKKYAIDALEPVEQAIRAMSATDFALDVAGVASKYADSIKKRAVSGEVIKLETLITPPLAA